MAIVYTAFGLIGIVVLTVILIVTLPTRRHAKENEKLLEFYKAKNKDANDILLEHLIMREQTYHRTYFIWQTLSKASGILSILLSVCTLVIPQDIPVFYSHFFTILSVLFVIFALYLLPEHKYRDYLLAYRKCGDLIARIVTSEKTVSEYAPILEEIESSLNSDIE